MGLCIVSDKRALFVTVTPKWGGRWILKNRYGPLRGGVGGFHHTHALRFVLFDMLHLLDFYHI